MISTRAPRSFVSYEALEDPLMTFRRRPTAAVVSTAEVFVPCEVADVPLETPPPSPVVHVIVPLKVAGPPIERRMIEDWEFAAPRFIVSRMTIHDPRDALAAIPDAAAVVPESSKVVEPRIAWNLGSGCVA